MSDLAVIEQNRPIPIRRTVLSLGRRVSASETISAMSAGESFVVDDEVGRKTALEFGYRKGIKLTSRKQEDGTFIIWRLK